ncbi:ExeA family protein [Acidiferrobacter thiooxydans]|uniref:ExeA family protein n=1 Tax=Acidiferrobacter thiooxydans TaxID=163359 RepID=UPI001475EB7B|nr:AAA family ATPase [Acidiferrobacter thiooxydans]
MKEHPFQITPDSDFLYMSAAHSRAKAYMDYSIRNRDGFVVITGEVGAGKTTLIRKLLSEFDDNVVVAKIFQTQLDETQFLQAVLVEFGLNPFNAGKVELMDMLSSFLVESFLKRKQLVLIVDEAQNLNRRVLEEIRMMSGLETEKQKILHVILVGQPELNETLDAPGLEQLTQRVRLRFHIAALTEAEAADYVYHRLRVAGAANPEALFARDAIPTIYEYTGGIPRLINTLCDTALTCAFADDSAGVDEATVKSAVLELQWKPFSARSRQAPRPMSAVGFDGNPGARDRDLKELAEAVASMEPRLDGIETLLKSMVTILQRRNRISLRVSENQIQQFLKQVSAEMEKLQANHHA